MVNVCQKLSESEHNEIKNIAFFLTNLKYPPTLCEFLTHRFSILYSGFSLMDRKHEWFQQYIFYCLYWTLTPLQRPKYWSENQCMDVNESVILLCSLNSIHTVLPRTCTMFKNWSFLMQLVMIFYSLPELNYAGSLTPD